MEGAYKCYTGHSLSGFCCVSVEDEAWMLVRHIRKA